MTSRVQKYYLAVLAISVLVGKIPAYAQEAPTRKADPCLIVPEEIVPLRVPDMNQMAVWKKNNGVKGEDKFRALMAVADGGQIVIGESRRYDERTGWDVRQIAMTRTDKSGKVIVSAWIPIKDLWAVQDAVLLKDKIAVLIQTGKEGPTGVGIQYLDGVGGAQKFYPLADTGRNITPYGVVSVRGGGGFVIMAQSTSLTDKNDSYTALYWMDTAGRLLKKKSYLPGIYTKPDSLTRLPDGRMIITGRVRQGADRDAGWVMVTGSDGNIIRQRPYARGADSTLRAAIPDADGGMVVVGDTLPANAGDKAAWVMRLDPTGNIIWQKYLTGKYEFAGVDGVALPDGRVQVLLAGRPTTFGGREHARIVTLSPTGQIVNDEAYIEGSNAIPQRLLLQNGLRYLGGIAETGFSDSTTPLARKYVTYDMWIMGLPAPETYTNRCITTIKDRPLDNLP